MPARKTKRRSSPSNTGAKLVPTLKKQGVLKGAGMFAAKQTGIKAMKTVVPAYLMIVGLSAATPALGSSIAQSTASIPVVGTLTSTANVYGRQLRSRLMPRA